MVDVADRGPGLARRRGGADLRQVLPRCRARRTAGGVGLGLTICRGIVTAHGGRIWAENRAGGGAVFHFTLPLVGTPPSGRCPAESDDGVSAMRPTAPLVLVIEDEPQMRRFLRTALESHDFRLVEAVTAREGLAQATGRNPDVILLDLGLPDLDGLEVTRRLREWSQHADHRHLGARPGAGQDRGARRRRRRLPHQAVRHGGAAGAAAGRAAPRRAGRRRRRSEPVFAVGESEGGPGRAAGVFVARRRGAPHPDRVQAPDDPRAPRRQGAHAPAAAEGRVGPQRARTRRTTCAST